MRALVIQDFSYSPDGLTIVPYRRGEVRDVRDELAEGLRSAGFITDAPLDQPASADQAQASGGAGEATGEGASSTPADAPVDPSATPAGPGRARRR